MNELLILGKATFMEAARERRTAKPRGT